jgi:hypothetical protein
MVWALAGKAKIHLSAIVRAILGAGFVFLLFGLIHLISEERRGVYPGTLMEQLINGAMFVTALGALPAILARPDTGASGAT